MKVESANCLKDVRVKKRMRRTIGLNFNNYNTLAEGNYDATMLLKVWRGFMEL